jgi:hypothetical protein
LLLLLPSSSSSSPPPPHPTARARTIASRLKRIAVLLLPVAGYEEEAVGATGRKKKSLVAVGT